MPQFTPSYRLHKPSGQAGVTLNGRDFYLGQYGTPTSREEYDQRVAEWLANNRQLPAQDNRERLTINELILAFYKHAEKHYQGPDGKPTSEVGNFKLSLRPMRKLYGQTLAIDFGPLALKTVRQGMLDDDLVRGVINQRVGRIRRMFRWAAENEMVPVTVYQALMTVRGLRRIRDGARESQAVAPVLEKHVNQVISLVSRQIAAMIQIQLLTGMRPGEVTVMRAMDIDCSGRVWLYKLPDHKTAWRGHDRVLSLGPKAQNLLQPYLKENKMGFLFSPKDAKGERCRELRANRQSKVQPSQQDRRKKKPRKAPGEHYTTRSYHQAISNACDKAFPPPDDMPEAEQAAWRKAHRWHPNQLRHTAGTKIRKTFDLDTARAVLGHRSPRITEVYAELDMNKANEVAQKIG